MRSQKRSREQHPVAPAGCDPARSSCSLQPAVRSLLLSVLCAACSQASSAAGPAGTCRPTGWVDRIEEGIAVVELDRGDREEYFPVACFPERPVPGTRVVRGRIDWDETARTRQEIDEILGRLLGPGVAR